MYVRFGVDGDFFKFSLMWPAPFGAMIKFSNTAPFGSTTTASGPSILKPFPFVPPATPSSELVELDGDAAVADERVPDLVLRRAYNERVDPSGFPVHIAHNKGFVRRRIVTHIHDIEVRHTKLLFCRTFCSRLAVSGNAIGSEGEFQRASRQKCPVP